MQTRAKPRAASPKKAKGKKDCTLKPKVPDAACGSRVGSEEELERARRGLGDLDLFQMQSLSASLRTDGVFGDVPPVAQRVGSACMLLLDLSAHDWRGDSSADAGDAGSPVEGNWSGFRSRLLPRMIKLEPAGISREKALTTLQLLADDGIQVDSDDALSAMLQTVLRDATAAFGSDDADSELCAWQPPARWLVALLACVL